MAGRSFRGWLYWIARTQGDVNAVKQDRVGRRIGRRLYGKATGRLARWLFR